MQQAGPTPEEMNAIVAKFNKDNPNIKVEIEYVSYDALHDKIATAMATNPPEALTSLQNINTANQVTVPKFKA